MLAMRPNSSVERRTERYLGRFAFGDMRQLEAVGVRYVAKVAA